MLTGAGGFWKQASDARRRAEKIRREAFPAIWTPPDPAPAPGLRQLKPIDCQLTDIACFDNHRWATSFTLPRSFVSISNIKISNKIHGEKEGKVYKCHLRHSPLHCSWCISFPSSASDCTQNIPRFFNNSYNMAPQTIFIRNSINYHNVRRNTNYGMTL